MSHTAPLTSLEQLACDWITSLGWDASQETGYVLSPGTEILDSPDQIVFIAGTGGPGYVTEEPAADAVSFQFRVRGPADDALAARLAADALDTLILSARFPAQVDGMVILNASRLGGRPSMLPLDPGDRRFELTANYVIVIGV